MIDLTLLFSLFSEFDLSLLQFSWCAFLGSWGFLVFVIFLVSFRLYATCLIKCANYKDRAPHPVLLGSSPQNPFRFLCQGCFFLFFGSFFTTLSSQYNAKTEVICLNVFTLGFEFFEVE